MTEEEPLDGILGVVGFGILNVSETVTVIRIVDMRIVIAMVIVVIVEDLEEIRMALERERGFPIDEVVIEIGILVAEVGLVHVGHTVLGQSTREKVVVVVVVEDLEEEMIDLQKKVMIMTLLILCVCW